jgi:hypothetical protein
VESLNRRTKAIEGFLKRASELQDEWITSTEASNLVEEHNESISSQYPIFDSSGLDLSMSFEGAVAKAKKYDSRRVTVLEGSTVRRALLESLSDKLRDCDHGAKGIGG